MTHSRTLLVVRLSALGDVIHTIPAVVSLRDQYDVTWVVEAPYRDLVEIVAGVKTIPVRMKRWTRHPSEMRHALRTMRGFDESIDFQGLIKSAVLPWAARTRVRTGFGVDAIREKPAAWFTNRKVSVDTGKHVIDQNMQLALAVIPSVRTADALLQIGEDTTSHPPAAPSSITRGEGHSRGVSIETLLPSTRGEGARRADEGCVARDEERTSILWTDFATPMPELDGSIVLLPGAGKPNKLWPIERFRELARRIGPRALAVWGPGERELAEAIGARVAPPTNLRELAGILQKAAVVVGADTGPLHLAAALETKVIGLFGPTDPRRNGPYGQLDHVIDRFRTTKSMESISVEEVMNMLQTVVPG